MEDITFADRHHEDADDMHEAEVMSRFKARNRPTVTETQAKSKPVLGTAGAPTSNISQEDGLGGLDPEALADITRTVQVEITQQLKAITEEMNRLKKEIYSEDGGLSDIQKALSNLRQKPLSCENTDPPDNSAASRSNQVQHDHDIGDQLCPDLAEGRSTNEVSSNQLPREIESSVPPASRAQCLDRALPRQRSAATSSSWDAPSMSWDAPGRSISRGSSVGRSGEWDTFTTELRGGRTSESRSRQGSTGRASTSPAVHAADWRVYFIVLMVLLLGPMRGVLREVYRLFIEDEGSQFGYDEWADAVEESVISAE